MLGKIPAARLALIEKIVAHAARTLPARARTGRRFVRAFFRGVAEEDLRAHAPADLAAAALAHLEFGRVRTGSRVLVELAPPLDADAPRRPRIARWCAWSRPTCRSWSIPSASCSAR